MIIDHFAGNNLYQLQTEELGNVRPKVSHSRIMSGRCPDCGGDILYYHGDTRKSERNGKKFVSYVEKVWECIQCPFRYDEDILILCPVKKSPNEFDFLQELPEKSCLCGQKFRPKVKRQKYCSMKCGDHYRRKK